MQKSIAHVMRQLTPTQAAFSGSLVLSLIAVVSHATLNRDGMLYVETAHNFLQDGFAAAYGTFNWPFFPILMALVSGLTGIGLENSGHLLNAFFMAGTCALLVACTDKHLPGTAWAACLVVLSLPGLNGYRDEIIREYGCWFFTLLSFWLALRWAETPRWQTGLIVQLSLIIAALFRPEAAAFLAALVLWQATTAPEGERCRRMLMVGALPLAALLLSFALIIAGGLFSEGRLVGVAQHFDLSKKQALFDLKAQALSGALIPYAKDQAGIILLTGSLALIPLKFIKQLGIFVLLLFFLTHPANLRTAFSRLTLFGWAFLAHLFVLSAFVIDMQFLAGRYVATLSLFAAPFLALGLHSALQRLPRAKLALAGCCLLLMVNNPLSMTSGKTHFIEAGQWLSTHAPKNASRYVESLRAAYYAGWRIAEVTPPHERQLQAGHFSTREFDFFVFEVSRWEKDFDRLLKTRHLRVLKKFESPQGDAIIVAVPLPAPQPE